MSDDDAMPAPDRPADARLGSIDAYRGLVMLAMASAGLGIPQVAAQLAESHARPPGGPWIWEHAAAQLDHVAWHGCTAWDLIQPSFMFLVGVAMPFSDAKRKAAGRSWGRRFVHAIVRSVVLVALGVFLQSHGKGYTDYEFPNVLAQIGLGYAFVFLVLRWPAWLQVIVALAILGGDWYLFYGHPLPSPEVTALTTEPDVEHYTGLRAHWNKNTNAASDFDRQFLNRLPRPRPFVANAGGYTTLNFVPSMATMIFGVVAGRWLRNGRYKASARPLGLLLAGAALLAVGTYLDGRYCPVVKRIWTPSWVLVSTAWTCWMLAGFYAVIDVLGWRGWSYPLRVVGANSIAMYLMAQLMQPFVGRSLHTHLDSVFDRLGLAPFAGPYAPIAEASLVLFGLWLICVYLYENRLFIKI